MKKNIKEASLPEKGTGFITGNAGEPRNGVPRTDEEREARHEDMEKFTDFEGCVKYFLARPDFQVKGGKTREESASALCAYIGRKAGKIASVDLSKDMLAGFNNEEEKTADLETLTSLVQELATKVEELIARGTESPNDLSKAFEESGYIKVPEPTEAIHNLPNTKSETILSPEEIASLPWEKVHNLAKKVKR